MEALLGLTLVLISLLIVFQLFFTADSTVAHADRVAQANQLARSRLELEVSRPYDALSSSQGQERVAHATRRGSRISTSFDYEVTVTEPDPAKKIKVVEVTVSWGERPKHQVSLASSKGELW